MEPWDGRERRRQHRDEPDIAHELSALDQTIRELHDANRRAADERRRDLDTRLGEIARTLATLEMTVAVGDGKLQERIAVHEAAPHHVGTQHVLDEHKQRLDGHERDLGSIRQRLGQDDGRREAKVEHRENRALFYLRWGVVIAVVGTFWQGVTQLVGGWVSNLISLWTSRGGAP